MNTQLREHFLRAGEVSRKAYGAPETHTGLQIAWQVIVTGAVIRKRNGISDALLSE